MSGYRHHAYARSLAEFGTPRALPRCGGWILERAIDDQAGRPGKASSHDAMGCYPLFSCRDWGALAADLDEIAGAVKAAAVRADGTGETPLVSVTLVSDPFGEHARDQLESCFPNFVVPFKEHHVIDLQREADTFVSRHHRKHARRALRELSVDVCDDPTSFLDEWLELHANLVARHRIEGIRAFSRTAFARQLAVPGAVMLRAELSGRPVGAQLWLVDGDVAYGHVLACSDAGYRTGAAYALYWSAIEYFAGKVRYCDIGAEPGPRSVAGGDEAEGLGQFKQGWSTGTRMAFLCGRIFDPGRYLQLTRARGAEDSAYFPAYRANELATVAPPAGGLCQAP